MRGNTDHLTANTMEDILRTLEESLRDVIQTPWVLHEARKDVRSFSRDDEIAWRVVIHENNPLKFIKSENKRGAKLIPDISCCIDGSTDSSNPINRLNLVLKLRSDNEDLYFREEWDSARIKREMKKHGLNERVMFRCHFDRGIPGEDGEPDFHLHIGGTAQWDELCWFPKVIRAPRFLIPPMDLPLACELVMSTFFPQKFIDLQEKPEWKSIIYTSEYHHLRPYFNKCANICNRVVMNRRKAGDDTLFRSFWLLES